MHESGQRKSVPIDSNDPISYTFKELNQLTGIAAILTFPLDVEVVEAEEREAEEERQRGQEDDQGIERPDGED